MWRWIHTLVAELWSLFVDDGILALAILLWVIALASGFRWLDLGPTAGAILLFLGPAGLLAESVLRRSRQK